MERLIILIGAIISGLLYRAGGYGKPFNTKHRDFGCSLIFLISLWLIKGFILSHWWMYLLVFGLMFGALTTYWDSLFGFDNFWFHGFMIGMATFPLFWAGIHWWAIFIYSISLAIIMGLWSKLISNDFWEEFGRGFTIIILMEILCL